MTDLHKLLQRVEASTSPDAELDGDLWCAVFAPDAVAVDHGTIFPPYTRSIDAATILVECALRGYRWLARSNTGGSPAYFANVYREEPEERDEGNFPTYAATAPLAILAAFLKAKIAAAVSS